MTTTAQTSDESVRFPSIASLRAAHNDLLKRFRASGASPEMNAEVEAFLRRGKATGALLDMDSDRWAAQSQLDYWVTQIYQPGKETPDAMLDEFDPELAPELDDSLCPYMGLDPFNESNRAVFFGRERLVDELVTKLKSTRFLAVLGSSGSGKSSVVRAGLLPELKNGAVPGSAAWKYFPPMVPGSNPLANLAHLMMSASGSSSATEPDAYRENPNHLRDFVARCFDETVVLVVDQFEEIFTLCTDESARQRFVDNLLSLCQSPQAEHRVIVTMRSDFETNVARLPKLQELFEQNTVRILPLTASELRESIEAPAAQIGLRFEEGVVDALLNDILGEPAALPLLQFTLLKLWENRDRNRVTWETYQRLGGGRKALAHAADELYNDLIPEEQFTMRRILLKMVRPGAGLEVTSNRVPRASLYQKTEANDRIDRVLDRLIRSRLVRTSEGDMDTDDQVEVAHEALVRNWPRLVEWLEEERVSLRQRQRLTAASEEWERLGRDPSALWRGVLLEEARHYDDLNDLESEFVQACYDAERSELKELEYRAAQLRRRSFYLTAALIVALIAVWAAISYGNQAEASARLALQEKQKADNAQVVAIFEKATAQASAKRAEVQANLALSNGLASQAQLILDQRNSKQLVAVLLAIQSMRLNPSAEAAQVLRSNSAAVLLQRMSHDGVVSDVAFSPNGKYVVSAGCERNDDQGVCVSGTARVWDVETGQEVRRMTQGGAVYSAAFSRDSQLVVSGGGDGTVHVWQASTGKEVARMQHAGAVSSVAFSPGGIYVVSGSADGTARVWESSTGIELARLIHGGPVYSVGFSQDGNYVVTAGCDKLDNQTCTEGSARVWEATTGKEVSRMTYGDTVLSAVFSDDGKYVASAGCDKRDDNKVCSQGSARVWEAATGKEVARMSHTGTVNSVAFSPDGKYVVSGGDDGTARVWGTTTGQQVARMTHDDIVYSVAFSPDGKSVISGSDDGTARVWDALTGKEIARMTHDDTVSVVAFSADGKHLVSGSYDKSVRIWEATTGKELARLTQGGTVYSVAFSPDSKYVVSGSYDKSAVIWEAITGKVVARLQLEQYVWLAVFSPDGKYVATASGDGTARVWEAATGKEISRMTHGEPVLGIAFSPDGKYVVSGSYDKTVRVWEALTGKEISRMTHDDKVYWVTFSRDGKYVASASYDKTARVWDAMTGKEISRMTQDDTVLGVAISPDNKYAVSGGYDKTARVWEVATGKEISRMTHQDRVYWVTFSPDGKYVLSAGCDVSNESNSCTSGSARLWDITNGKEIARMTHDGWVYPAVFSPDGKYIVSSSYDKTARVWEAATGKEVARMTHDDGVHFAAFSPDGKYVVSGGYDKTARVWIWQPEDLIQSTCSHLPRNLTREEWNQYIGDALPYQAVCPNLPIESEGIAFP